MSIAGHPRADQACPLRPPKADMFSVEIDVCFVSEADCRPVHRFVRRENVILCFHYRMAREPALGVVPLRRLVSYGPGVNVSDAASYSNCGPSPFAAVREPLAVLHHEINVMQGVRPNV